MLVTSLTEHFINYIKKDQQNFFFHLNGNTFQSFATVEEKSEIWFQYMVYYIIHTCNTNNNTYTAISKSYIYDVLYSVKEICFLMEMIK